jgi:hypothetical protein
MVKTMNKKNKRNNKTSKKLSGHKLSGRKLSGGKPLFIKTVAQYKDGILVKYNIQQNKMDKDQQEGYAKLHKVFYPLNEPSEFLDIFKIDPKKMKLLTKPFFSPSDPNNKPDEEESQTIVINSLNDREDVRVANQIIQNINNDKTIPKSLNNYDGDIPTFIQEYKKLIETHKNILLANTDYTKGRKMLNTPVFLNIIGKKYEYITDELPDLDDLEKQMAAPSMAAPSMGATNTVQNAAAAGPAILKPAVVPKHIELSKRLKQLIAASKA